MLRLIAFISAVLVAGTLTAAAAGKTDMALCAGGKGGDAIAACTRLIADGHLPPDKLAAAYDHRARAKFSAEDAGGAIADYDSAIKRYPGWAVGHRMRAELLAAMGRSGEAIASYSKRIELAPNNAFNWQDRGDAYRAAGDLKHALADYSAAIARKPGDPRFWHARAMAYKALGDKAHALADLDKTLELSPNYARAYRERAALRRAMGDTAAAKADEAKADAVPKNWPGPGDFLLLLLLGLLLNPLSIISGVLGGDPAAPALAEPRGGRRRRRSHRADRSAGRSLRCAFHAARLGGAGLGDAGARRHVRRAEPFLVGPDALALRPAAAPPPAACRIDAGGVRRGPGYDDLCRRRKPCRTQARRNPNRKGLRG